MRRVMFAVALVALLLSITFTVALAGVGMEDPALCVAGQWLVVTSAQQSGIKVFVPDGTAYGQNGDCTGDPPAGEVYSGHVVRTRAAGDQLTVEINGKHASDSVTVTYNGVSDTQTNSGKGLLFFTFNLPQ